jgi:hypothetical protein
MKCPACAANFDLTWRLYLKAPLGRFPCPSCAAPLTGVHRWYYWPLLLLGGCAFGLPLGWIAYRQYGWRMGLIAGFFGSLLSGVPIDRFLESRFTILKVREKGNGTAP